MNRIILMLVLLASASGVMANENWKYKQDYKCYIETTNKPLILFFQWDSRKLQQRMLTLVAQPVPDTEGPYRPYIRQVHECVKLYDSFNLIEAKELDRVTLK